MGSNLSAERFPELTRHLGREFASLEALTAAAEAAQALLASPGWDVLCRLLDAEVATIDAKLDGRLMDTRADYAHLHGRRGGLRAAPAFLEALIDRAESRVNEQRLRHEGAGETVLEGVVG